MAPRSSLTARARGLVARGWATGRRRMVRGYHLARRSQVTLRRNPRLVVFSLASGAGMLVVFLALGLPGLWLLRNGHWVIGLLLELAAFAGMAYVRTYVGSGLVRAIVAATEGERLGFRDAMRATRPRAVAVGGWALLSGGVQLVLRPIPLASSRWVGTVVGRALGVSWGLLTLMILPVITFHGKGPVRSLRTSAGLFRDRWGEGIVGNAWVTGVTLIVGGVPAVALTAIGLVLLLYAGAPITGYTLVTVGVALGVLTAAATMTVAQIFAVALYRFATEGVGTAEFGPEVLADIADHRGGAPRPESPGEAGGTPPRRGVTRRG